MSKHFDPHWITFEDGSQGCCDGWDADDAAERAVHKTMKEVVSAEILPYPASPIIWLYEHPEYGHCPPFCYTPKTCKGKTSCPKNRACSE